MNICDWQICIHGEVRSYVDSILESLHIMMQSNKVHLFCILILDSTKELVEKFVFEVSALENLRNIAWVLHLKPDKWLQFYQFNKVKCTSSAVTQSFLIFEWLQFRMAAILPKVRFLIQHYVEFIEILFIFGTVFS